PRPGLEDLVISGVDFDDRQARVTVLHAPDRSGHAARIFRRVADAGVYVDMIVQNVGTGASPNLSFTVRRGDAPRAPPVARGGGVRLDPDVAKLSVRGVGMRTHTGVASRVFGALAGRGIRPAMINTSEIRINVAVDLDRAREAQECLARAFLRRSGHDPAAQG